MNKDKRLQEIFFNLISKLFTEANWDKKVYKNILTQISDYIQTDFIALYMFYEKVNNYKLVDSTAKRKGYQILESVARPEKPAVEYFYLSSKDEKYRKLVSLVLPSGEEFIMIIINEESVSDLLIAEVKREVEKLLSIVHQMMDKLISERNNKFLLDISTKLLNTHDQGIILYGINDTLKTLYPSYHYQLYLTQEHDTPYDLPLKTLKYTDEYLHDKSTEVFMTGELQVALDQTEREKKVFAPLVGEQSVYGVLELIAPIEDYFSDQELDFIVKFAALAGKSLEKTILYEDSLMQVSNLTLLNDIIHDLNTTSDLKEITAYIHNEMISITKASEIGFIYFDEASDHSFHLLPSSTAFFNERKGKALIEELRSEMNDGLEPIFRGNNQELERYGFRSIMVIPMVYSGLSFGITVVLHEDKYHFTFENFKLIESLIQHAAVVISNTMLKEKLKTAVITDYLTQLYSRSYLEDQITEHISNGNKGVLMLFDIDNFKGVNDRFGHHIGDKVLIQVAEILKGCAGNTGISARWGGEELAVYLSEVNLEFAIYIAEEIREKIAVKTNPAITVSCGLGGWSKGENASQASLFLKADQALYDAKSNGKDQIVVA